MRVIKRWFMRIKDCRMRNKHYMHPYWVQRRIEIYGEDPATDPLIQQEAKARLSWKDAELPDGEDEQ